MASTQLTDVIIPDVYLSYTAVNNPELTAFFQSGVAVPVPNLSAVFASGGRIAFLPYWKDLDPTVEPNYGTDNVGDVATPQKVTAGEMATRIAQLNQGYSAADLVTEIAGSSPMQQVRNRFGAYWMHQWQRRLLAVVKGVIAENIANGSSDMIYNAALETTVGVTNANLFSRGAFTAAVFSLGDHFGQIVAMAVHSVVYKRMVDNDDITFIPPSHPDPTLPLEAQQQAYYLGKRIIVDDTMPTVAGSGNPASIKYTSVLFGAGAIGYAEGITGPQIPVEVYRRPDEGNGAGIEQIWERKSWIIHPFGYKWLEESLTNGYSPTWADLGNAANWQRQIDRRLVPLAFLITNG